MAEVATTIDEQIKLLKDRGMKDHNFKEDTKFDYAIRLYYFDFDLRNLILRYISRIEVNFRTTLIYTASNKYKEDPYWYINHKYVKSTFIDDNLL